MMIKILYFNNFEAPYRVPFYNLLGNKYKLTLLLTDKPEDVKERNAKWFSREKKIYQTKYLRKDLFCIVSLYDMIKNIKRNDVVFMDMYGTKYHVLMMLLMYLFNKKIYLSVDGLLKKNNESFFRKLLKSIVLHRPNIILSPSPYVDRCLMSYGVNKNKILRYHFTSINKSDIVNYDMQTDEYKLSLRNELNLPTCENCKIILTVGRFTNASGIRKGYDILLESMGLLPKNYYLVIVGGTPDEYFTKILESRKDNRVILVDFKDKETLKKYYDSADVFCLQTREDIWGLVVNEAMARGLPIVTTSTCGAGIALVKNGKNGYIGDADDIDKLVTHLKMILENEEIRMQMGKNCVKIISNWTIEKMAAEHYLIFDKSS